MKRNAGVVALLAAVGACTQGCAPRAGGAGSPDAPEASQVWPMPPARARIRFLASVARPGDLTRAPSLGRWLRELAVGGEEQGFVRPTGLVASGSRLYVADPGVPALWLLDRDEGRMERIAGGGDGSLVSPVALAVGAGGQIVLADSGLARLLLFDAEGRAAGSLAPAGFRRPVGVAYDAARDRLYVADAGAHCVWVLTGDGRQVGVIGSRGTQAGQFNFPTHLGVDRNGELVVVDSLNYRVQRFDPEGRLAGALGRQGDSSGDLAAPKGVALDRAGRIYLVDALFDAVQIFDQAGRHLLTFGERGVGPGQLWLPGGISIDTRGRIAVADSYNGRVQLFEYVGGDDE